MLLNKYSAELNKAEATYNDVTTCRITKWHDSVINNLSSWNTYNQNRTKYNNSTRKHTNKKKKQKISSGKKNDDKIQAKRQE